MVLKNIFCSLRFPYRMQIIDSLKSSFLIYWMLYRKHYRSSHPEVFLRTPLHTAQCKNLLSRTQKVHTKGTIVHSFTSLYSAIFLLHFSVSFTVPWQIFFTFLLPLRIFCFFNFYFLISFCFCFSSAFFKVLFGTFFVKRFSLYGRKKCSNFYFLKICSRFISRNNISRRKHQDLVSVIKNQTDQGNIEYDSKIVMR